MTNSSSHQKSFSANLEIPGRTLNLLATLYGKPAISKPTMGSGGVFSGRIQPRDDSRLLGSRPNADVGVIAQLKLYFWYTPEGYEIYILDNEPHLPAWRLSKSTNKILGAVDRNLNKLTAFDLINQNNNVVTLDNFNGNRHQVKLKARDGGFIGGMKVPGSPFSYIADIGMRDAVTFNLNILGTHLPDRDTA
jgi:hypothetical protein